MPSHRPGRRPSLAQAHGHRGWTELLSEPLPVALPEARATVQDPEKVLADTAEVAPDPASEGSGNHPGPSLKPVSSVSYQLR
jgi:hypothetical protein